MPWKRVDLHEDIVFIGEDKRKYPEEWHRGKKCPSEGMDNKKVERIFKRWRTRGEAVRDRRSVGGW